MVIPRLLHSDLVGATDNTAHTTVRRLRSPVGRRYPLTKALPVGAPPQFLRPRTAVWSNSNRHVRFKRYVGVERGTRLQRGIRLEIGPDRALAPEPFHLLPDLPGPLVVGHLGVRVARCRLLPGRVTAWSHG